MKPPFRIGLEMANTCPVDLRAPKTLAPREFDEAVGLPICTTIAAAGPEYDNARCGRDFLQPARKRARLPLVLSRGRFVDRAVK